MLYLLLGSQVELAGTWMTYDACFERGLQIKAVRREVTDFYCVPE